MPPDLVVLRGGSGTGKSSLLRNLRPSFPTGSAIDSDDIRDLLNAHDWMDPAAYSTCLSAVAALVRCHVRSGVAPVLVADTFEWPVLADFLGELDDSGRIAVVSLYATRTTTTTRMRARDGVHLIPAALDNSLRQGGEARLTRPGSHAVDTDDLDELGVCEAVVRTLAESTQPDGVLVGDARVAIEAHARS